MASHVVWLVSRECPRRYSFTTTTTTTTHGSACPQVKVNICCFTGRSNIFVGIQLFNSQSIFETACELFLKKWRSATLVSESITDFLTYFEKNWVEKKASWFEGYAIGIPSQSNGIVKSQTNEGVIKYISENDTPIGNNNKRGRKKILHHMEREKVKPEKNNKVDMCPAPAVQERILPEEPIPEDNYD